MKIGVISDTHKNIEYLRGAIRTLLDENVDVFIHLGDDFEDTEVFGEFGIDSVIKVPGVYDLEYSDRRSPHRIVEDFLEWRVMVSHTPVTHSNDFPDDLKPEDLCAQKEIDVLLHGHTHIPSITRREGILYFNPGHLKQQDKKGYPPSFGILEFTQEKVFARIIDFTTRKDLYSEEIRRRET